MQRAVVAAMTVLAISACSSYTDGRPSAAPSWITTTDPTTGVAFDLPARPTATSSTKTGPGGRTYRARTYLARLSDRDGSSVTFIKYSNGYVADLNRFPAMIASEFVSAGASDAKAFDIRRIRFDGRYPGIDFRFSFTPLGGGLAKPAWFERVINLPGETLVIQTVAFAKPAESSRSAAESRRIQSRVIASVRLP